MLALTGLQNADKYSVSQTHSRAQFVTQTPQASAGNAFVAKCALNNEVNKQRTSIQCKNAPRSNKRKQAQWRTLSINTIHVTALALGMSAHKRLLHRLLVAGNWLCQSIHRQAALNIHRPASHSICTSYNWYCYVQYGQHCQHRLKLALYNSLLLMARQEDMPFSSQILGTARQAVDTLRTSCITSCFRHD